MYALSIDSFRFKNGVTQKPLVSTNLELTTMPVQ